MTLDNFHGTLEAFLNRVPYEPFVVQLINGERYEIDHVKSIAYRDGPAVYFKPGGGMVIFDHKGVNQIITGLLQESDSAA